MEYWIPGNVPSSKNSRVWTGKFLVASKSTQKWRKDTANHWKSMREAFRALTEQIAKPLKVTFTFVRGTKHQFDYVNPLQTILDEMVHHGWIDDDNADEVIPIFKPYEYDKNNPGVKIEV